MNRYEQLLSSSDENIVIIEKNFRSKAKGLCKGNKIGISKDIKSINEKACVLSEELGHHYTSAGNIIDLQDTMNRKQECRARLWAYDKMIGLVGIINAFNANCRNRHEIAEFLDVTEEFLNDALECYKKKYGICKIVDNYVIYFIPSLSVAKIFE